MSEQWRSTPKRCGAMPSHRSLLWIEKVWLGKKINSSSSFIVSPHLPRSSPPPRETAAMDALITKRESHPYMQLHEKVLIPLTPPPPQNRGANNNNNNSLRSVFGILTGLCLFIVYYWSSASSAAPGSVAGEYYYYPIVLCNLWKNNCQVASAAAAGSRKSVVTRNQLRWTDLIR